MDSSLPMNEEYFWALIVTSCVIAKPIFAPGVLRRDTTNADSDDLGRSKNGKKGRWKHWRKNSRQKNTGAAAENKDSWRKNAKKNWRNWRKKERAGDTPELDGEASRQERHRSSGGNLATTTRTKADGVIPGNLNQGNKIADGKAYILNSGQDNTEASGSAPTEPASKENEKILQPDSYGYNVDSREPPEKKSGLDPDEYSIIIDGRPRITRTDDKVRKVIRIDGIRDGTYLPIKPLEGFDLFETKECKDEEVNAEMARLEWLATEGVALEYEVWGIEMKTSTQKSPASPQDTERLQQIKIKLDQMRTEGAKIKTKTADLEPAQQPKVCKDDEDIKAEMARYEWLATQRYWDTTLGAKMRRRGEQWPLRPRVTEDSPRLMPNTQAGTTEQFIEIPEDTIVDLAPAPKMGLRTKARNLLKGLKRRPQARNVEAPTNSTARPEKPMRAPRRDKLATIKKWSCLSGGGS